MFHRGLRVSKRLVGHTASSETVHWALVAFKQPKSIGKEWIRSNEALVSNRGREMDLT